MDYTSEYAKYWAVKIYYMIQTGSAKGKKEQAYLRRAELARKLAEVSLRGSNEIDLGFYADRFNVALDIIKRDVREINFKAGEPDLVARVRASPDIIAR